MTNALRTVKRRRLENKTDYRLRLNLLKSKDARIVIRKTNKYIIAQLVESREAQDKIIKGVTSKDLLDNGWDSKFEGSLKSIPAAYLTGILLAKKIGKGKFIIDLGLQRNQHGSRLYAAVKGLIDGGLEIAADKKAFPPQERLDGEHVEDAVKAMIKKVKENLGTIKEEVKTEKKAKVRGKK